VKKVTFNGKDFGMYVIDTVAKQPGNRVAIDLFKAGKDIYLETANSIIGAGGDSRRYRNLGKEIVLGLNNGRSAYSIYESLARLGFGYDLDDVQRIIFRYDMEFAGIKAWRDDIVSSALKNGVISTGLGRSLKVAKDANINSLFNYPVQGAAADGFKVALNELDEQLVDQDAKIVHILHDEIIVEASEDIADSVAAIVKTCMERAFINMLPGVPYRLQPFQTLYSIFLL
ncbi:MAG: DNA polymerase, partial [Nitrospinales bacterium]